MKRFCCRFKNSIIAVIQLLLYLSCAAALFGMLGIDNFQVLKISRTSAVMAFTYILFGILMTRTYGKYDVDIRKSRPIII